jgi:hypothetical protein
MAVRETFGRIERSVIAECLCKPSPFTIIEIVLRGMRKCFDSKVTYPPCATTSFNGKFKLSPKAYFEHCGNVTVTARVVNKQIKPLSIKGSDHKDVCAQGHGSETGLIDLSIRA